MLEHRILIHAFSVRMLYYASLYYATLYYATLYYGTLYYETRDVRDNSACSNNVSRRIYNNYHALLIQIWEINNQTLREQLAY